jgi:hypothetical protein
MTGIEAKALALVNGVKTERGRNSYSHYTRLNRALDDGYEALCRAIEQHEAFRKEVSDAVVHCRACSDPEAWTRIKFELERFIPKPKPDPLAGVLAGVLEGVTWYDNEITAKEIRKALAARGLEIREKNND